MKNLEILYSAYTRTQSNALRPAHCLILISFLRIWLIFGNCCCFIGNDAGLQETSASLRNLPLRAAAGQVTPGNRFKLA